MNGKLQYLEGIRGVMAINVLVSHFIVVFYPQMYSAQYTSGGGGFWNYLRQLPFQD